MMSASYSEVNANTTGNYGMPEVNGVKQERMLVELAMENDQVTGHVGSNAYSNVWIDTPAHSSCVICAATGKFIAIALLRC